MVRLASSEGVEFVVSKEVANQSALIRHMLEDLGGDEDVPIPLHNVSSPILSKVIEYAEHHKNDGDRKIEAIDDWDREFMQVDQGTLFELMLAANYLDMKSLLDLGCRTVAGMIKGKSVEEIRRTFNIANDFTPEEEDQIRKENEWCEDK